MTSSICISRKGISAPSAWLFSLLLALHVGARVRADATHDADALFNEGVTALKEAQCGEAARKFEQSYQTSPHWKTLYNLGYAYQCADRPVDAVDVWERYVQQSDDATRRRQVAREVDKQKTKIGTLSLHVLEVGARVFIDGKEVGSTPLREPVRLKQGDYSLQVLLDNYWTEPQDVHIVGGKATKLSVALPPNELQAAAPSAVGQASPFNSGGDSSARESAPSAHFPAFRSEIASRDPSVTLTVPAPEPSRTAVPASTRAREPESGLNVQRVIGWSLIGVAAAGAVTGTVLFAVGEGNHNAAERRQHRDEESAERLNSDANLLKTVGVTVLGGSGALLLAGAIGVLTAPSGREDTRAGLRISGWASASSQGIQVLQQW